MAVNGPIYPMST